MNILHISRTMGQGGAEKVVYQICKEAPKEIKMYIASTGGVLEDKLKTKDITHITIPDIDNKNPFLMLKTLVILHKTIKKYKIDIIHSHHRMAAFYSRVLCLFNPKIKRIYTAHNVFFNKIKLLRFALKGSQIIAVGNGVKNNLTHIYGIDAEQIKVIYNSIDVPQKINTPKDEIFINKKEKVFIGTIGRLTEQKGIDIFIKALANIIKDNKNVYGIVIGDGELKDELIQLSRNLNIEKNIIFLGYRKDIFDLISCMDFLVLSSRWEGFPLTPIECFAMGKTIIVSNIEGNNEIVDDNINGLLFIKENIANLTLKIKYLIKNKETKKQLEKNSFSKYKATYSYQKFFKEYFKTYQDLK